MIKNILFDLDGTLANTALDLANALNAVRLSCELPELPIDIIRPTVSLGANAMIKLGFGFEEGHPEFEEIRRKFLHLYSKNIAQETHLYEGIEEVLKKIERTKKTWGIVTNKSSWLTIPLLKALSLDKRAACIVCGDTVKHNKPHPAPIIHACKLIKSDPASTIFIGDAERDIEAGRKAGTKTVVALYGYIDENDNPKDWGADGMISSPHEIHAILDDVSK
jgi:phosphoglycolate phosphatase